MVMVVGLLAFSVYLTRSIAFVHSTKNRPAHFRKISTVQRPTLSGRGQKPTNVSVYGCRQDAASEGWLFIPAQMAGLASPAPSLAEPVATG